MEPDDEAPAGTGTIVSASHWRRWLFLVVLGIYALTAAGQFQTIDAAQELSVAVSIRAGRGVQSDYPTGLGGGTSSGRGGWDYTGHDIGSSLVYLPFTLVPGSIARTPPSTRTPHPDVEVVGRQMLLPSRRLFFVASFLPPLLGALIVLVFAQILGEIGFDDVTAAITSLLVALTSVIWVYAHVSFDATLTTLGVVTAVWRLARLRRTGDIRDALLASACTAGAILVRVDSLVMVPALIVPIVVAVWHRRATERARALRLLIAGAAPILAALAVDLAFNWWRFGSISDNGHQGDGALRSSWQLGPGLFGQVISPGKGLLVLSPLAVVALFRWRRFARRDAVLATAIGGAVLLNVVAHAAIEGWAGDQAWGARFVVPIVPLVLIPLAFVVRDARRGRLHPALRATTVLLAVVGFAIQLTGMLVDFFAVVTSRRLRGASAATDYFHLAYVDGARTLWRAMHDAQPYPGLTPGWVDILRPVRFDLWWVRAASTSGWNVATLGVPVALVVLIAIAVGKLRSSLSDPPQVPPRHMPATRSA